MTGQNPPLKCCQPLELLTQLKKGNRSLNAENLRSIEQMAGCQTLKMIQAHPGSNPGRMRLHTIWVEWLKRQTFS